MRVFSVEMLVKEEGAAVVEAALNRLKKETQAVAAEMKTTSQAVTGTGAAMRTTAVATEISGTRAAKAAVGFAAVGQSIARTGSLTADAGTRIIEAGSQIATMFGPTGLAVAAVLGGLTALMAMFNKADAEIQKFQQSMSDFVNRGDLQSIQNEIDKIQLGTAIKAGKDALPALVQELDRLTLAFPKAEEKMRRFGVLSGKEGEAYRRMFELKELIREKSASLTDLRNKFQLAQDAQRYHTVIETQATQAVKEGNKALKERAQLVVSVPSLPSAASMGPTSTTIAPAPVFDTSKIQAAIPQATDAVLTASGQAAQKMADNIRQTFQDGVSAALTGGIVAGIEQAVASGSIAEGFKAMSSMMLAGLGDAMIRFGIASEAFAGLMQTIMTSLGSLLPGGALAASIAMIGIGAALKGVARGMFGKQSGGAAFSTASFGGAGFGGGLGAMTLPTTQLVFGNTSATTAAGMQPRQPMNITVIGPNDPTAQRTIQELMVKANSRGRVG